MPPYGAITLTVVVDATIDTFNQTAYIVGLAALLGNVPRSAIQLSVTAGSLVVRATVRVYSAAVNNPLMTRIYSITPAQLAAATGSSVLTISGVTATLLFPSPTQPPPPRVPEERAIWSPLWWLLIALGIGVCVLLVGLWTRWLCCGNSAGQRNPQPIAVTYDPRTMHPGIQLPLFPSQRFPGSPGSPVGRTPAPSSHPGRETFRGAGRPRPPPTAPPANPPQPPEWDWDVTSPTEGTAGANFAPGSIATRNQALVMQEMYADEDYMERVRSTRLATRQTV